MMDNIDIVSRALFTSLLAILIDKKMLTSEDYDLLMEIAKSRIEKEKSKIKEEN